MNFIDLSKQYARMKSEIDANIQKVLDHGRYVMGPEITEVEQQLADFVGVKHCLAVSSGTTALQIALMALEIGPGDEVITTDFSFFASAEVILLVGAKPVFVDIDPVTYNIDPDKLEAAITERTKAIAPVSLYGQCADMTAINAVAAKHGLAVVEDAAQSFGALHHGRRSCGLSTIGCTSFFPTKPLGCYGDGGACFTDDAELAENIRQIRQHGEASRYNHVRVGITGRLASIQAAVLKVKLKYFPDEIIQRQQAAAMYTEKLAGVIKTPQVVDGNESVFAQYTIEVDDREAWQKKLQERGIPTAVHYPKTLHEQKACEGIECVTPHALSAARRVMSLPFGPDIAESEINEVVKAIKQVVVNG